MGEPSSPNPSPSPELSPLDIGLDIAPIRIPKEAGQTDIDFGGLLSPPLQLHEDLKEGCGGQLWPAGIVLGRHLLEDTSQLSGKTIIELGAGGGLVGLGIALALSRKPGAAKQPVLITDLPQLLPLQEQNIQLNRLDKDAIISASFPWGGPIPDTIPSGYDAPDLVLAADCVYFEPAFPLLLDTLHALLDHSERHTVCYFCMKKRRKADMRFITALRKGFRVLPITFIPLEEDERNVYLYQITRKLN